MRNPQNDKRANDSCGQVHSLELATSGLLPLLHRQFRRRWSCAIPHCRLCGWASAWQWLVLRILGVNFTLCLRSSTGSDCRCVDWCSSCWFNVNGHDALTLAPGNGKNFSVAGEHGNADGHVHGDCIDKLVVDGYEITTRILNVLAYYTTVKTHLYLCSHYIVCRAACTATTEWTILILRWAC